MITETIGVRRQLTLFVPHHDAVRIEVVREQVDPEQFGLIAAHVTLCREAELADLSVAVLRQRLARAALPPLTLTFGPPERFADHGMLLPCVDGTAAFDHLRVALLGTTDIRTHAAHVTLAHPRNPRTLANVDATFASLPARLEITFPTIAMIEQHGAHAWVVRETMLLDGRDDRAHAHGR